MDCIVHGVTKSQTWLSDFHKMRYCLLRTGLWSCWTRAHYYVSTSQFFFFFLQSFPSSWIAWVFIPWTQPLLFTTEERKTWMLKLDSHIACAYQWVRIHPDCSSSQCGGGGEGGGRGWEGVGKTGFIVSDRHSEPQVSRPAACRSDQSAGVNSQPPVALAKPWEKPHGKRIKAKYSNGKCDWGHRTDCIIAKQTLSVCRDTKKKWLTHIYGI